MDGCKEDERKFEHVEPHCCHSFINLYGFPLLSSASFISCLIQFGDFTFLLFIIFTQSFEFLTTIFFHV